jgi:predicted GNAT family N-acyltransferase
MEKCSILSKLKIVAGDISDYKRLASFHYRHSMIGPFKKIFAIKPTKGLRHFIGTETVGVIIYGTAALGVELRNTATENMLTGLDGKTRAALINKNFRCITRVIIEPRFRGLGLGSKLVRETLAKADVPIVEALAVMGSVNSFFEKAGMTSYTASQSRRCVQMTEAFGVVGIKDDEFINTEAVNKKLNKLTGKPKAFIENQIRRFLQGFNKKRYLADGIERTRFVLSKLTDRPIYYIWFNPEFKQLIV